MKSNALQNVSHPVATAVRIAMALVGLALALGCATSRDGAAGDETTSVSVSRCAPGRVLDARHGLCNGVSGRWW